MRICRDRLSSPILLLPIAADISPPVSVQPRLAARSYDNARLQQKMWKSPANEGNLEITTSYLIFSPTNTNPHALNTVLSKVWLQSASNRSQRCWGRRPHFPFGRLLTTAETERWILWVRQWLLWPACQFPGQAQQPSIIIIKMSLIKVALSHCFCRTTLQCYRVMLNNRKWF